ncbi:transporter, putative [Methanococcus vannielii SB]|uniref:Transporter, putative n=2 Tax=Methanococcus vannielii TaxID=2187 RepID=A6USH2_METVS|nr:transporter, putative [Methanococcus vannielii SB]
MISMEVVNILSRVEKFIAIVIIVVSFILFILSIYTLTLDVLYSELTGEYIYVFFSQFLQNVLLFIIGLELALTLTKHSFSNIIELLLFALVRKILISTEPSRDIALIIFSIIALIAVKQFITREKMSEDL